jgi:hypothetical protein
MENPPHPLGRQPAFGYKALWQQPFRVPHFCPAAMNPGLADPCRGAQGEPAVECPVHHFPGHGP